MAGAHLTTHLVKTVADSGEGAIVVVKEVSVSAQGSRTE
jgi:hypothetical protein